MDQAKRPPKWVLQASLVRFKRVLKEIDELEASQDDIGGYED